MQPPGPRRPLLRALGRLASWPLALLILFEEWGWEPLQRLLQRLARRLGLQDLEAWIAQLAPGAALLIFLVPSVLLLPIKLIALWLIGNHHYVLGMTVIIAAKLAGTAIVARLFTLTKPALLRLSWFAAVYGRWSAWKEALLAHVRASWPWRAGRVIKRRWRRRWDLWLHGS